MRARRPDPDPRAVRRFAAFVVLLYALPLALAGIVAIAWELGDVSSSWTSLRAFLLIVGGVVAWHCIEALVRYRRQGRVAPPTPFPKLYRTIVLNIFPEFKGLQFEAAERPFELSIGRSRLRIGSDRAERIDAKNGSIDDTLFFLLAHEARHFAVDAFGWLRILRALRTVYLVVGAFTYCAFLLNWSDMWDGPDRIALLVYVCVVPYLWALLLYVLDEGMVALEWHLELDADAAAHGRSRAAGRTGDFSSLLPSHRYLRQIAERHPPSPLRIAMIQGRSLAHTIVYLVLGIGLIVAVEPVVMLILFQVAEGDEFSLARTLLGIGNIAFLVLATVALVAATALQPRRDGGTPPDHISFAQAGCVAVFRVHQSAMRFLLVGTAFLAVAFAVGAGNRQTGDLEVPVTFGLVAAVFAGCTAGYYMAGWTKPSAIWIVVASVLEWLRLICSSAFVLALGVLPFFGDFTNLGKAMMEHGHLVGLEFERILSETPHDLAGPAIGSFVFILTMALLAMSGNHVIRRNRWQG